MTHDTATDTLVATKPDAKPTLNDRIICHIDGEMVHSIKLHIDQKHSDTWTVERYVREFPGQPLMSEYAREFALKRKKEAEEAKLRDAAALKAQASAAGTEASTLTVNMAYFHDIFELGSAPAARSATGNNISISILSGHDMAAMDYLPDIDTRYVFNIDLLKRVMMAYELNKPIYLWGFHGTGKTTVLEQASARTKRPFVRVQHTLNMQESDVLGQWTVRDGATQFQLGPLPMAMINGWVYCADEYDVAMPAVTALYQPVLEGKALLIKEAPQHLRRIVPHPQFRFAATGNTNGIGDETGLYQGTLVQNAANYSRFAITEEVKYMEPAIETSILMSRVTDMSKADANKVVKFANEVRKMFAEGRLSMTISPRELINACELAAVLGGNIQEGIKMAFSNRLSRVDSKTVGEYLQRAFGNASA